VKDDDANNAWDRGATLIYSNSCELETLVPANGGDRGRFSRWLAGGFPFATAAALHQPAVLCCPAKGTCPVRCLYFAAM